MEDVRSVRAPMMVVAIQGEAYRGIVVIDSFTNETSSGGVRIADEVSEKEVRALAREMTLKYSFFRLPLGGAKAGISVDNGISREEKSRVMRDFGAKLGPLIRSGVYYPGMDLNCGEEDLRQIYSGAGINIGRRTDTGFFTALSVREAIHAYRQVYVDPSVTLRLAIDGFGRVATHLITMLPESHFKVVAFSTFEGGRVTDAGFDKEELLQARRTHGDHMVQTMTAGKPAHLKDIVEADVDLLVPSSRTWVVHDENACQIRARAVIPIANAPYTESAIDTLQHRGVICLPGFVTNAGGVFGSSLFDQGVALKAIDSFTVNFYRPLVQRLLEESRRRSTSPVRLAEVIAESGLPSRGEIPRRRGLAQRLIRRLKRRMEPRRHSSAAALRTLQESTRSVMRGLAETRNS